jgi:nicotinate-nucleotide--dimethylbenzimidazole phosphoribosyltransferase
MSLDGPHTVLVLGGIRSGKSEYAESLVADADVRYVATGPAPDPARDAEWAERLAAHRERRPAGWSTEETGADPGRLAALLAEAKPEETILVDDLGGWLTAVLTDTGWSAPGARSAIDGLADAVRECVARVVVVSPEVGMSVIPETESGRAFADAVGVANRALAEVVDGVVLVIAGQPTWLKRAGQAVRGTAAAEAPVAVAAGELEISSHMILPLPDEAASVAATERLRLLDVTGSGLGGLGRLVSFAASVRGAEVPRPFEAVRVLLVYGEHEGDAAAGDAALDWPRRLADAHRGAGPLAVLAARVGASVHTVDTVTADGLGVAGALEAGDAMPVEAVEEAIRYGVRTVQALIEEGTDLLVLAAAGAGQEAVATALISSTTGREPAGLLARVLVPGGAIDDNAWMARCAAVRDGLRRARGDARNGMRLLATVGGPDFAVAVGAILGAASSRVPVVLDGPVGVAAAMVARELAGQIRLWSMMLDEGTHPAVRAGLDVLSVEPLVKLELGLGEGANALAVLPLLQAALVLSTLDTVPPAEGPDVA